MAGGPMDPVPVIPLREAPGSRTAWSRSPAVVYLWGVVELLMVTNAWQPSSRLRVAALRLFGAKIGDGVIFRPGARVKFPWNLEIGDASWIGEDVWFHNQDRIVIGHDAVISQGTFLTTGSHRHRSDMGLVTAPIVIHSGAWITSRCIVLGGVTVGRSALVKPLTRVDRDVEPNAVWDQNGRVAARFS